MKCKDSSVEVLIICYCFFKGINELAEGLGPAYLLSRTKKEAAADEAKEKLNRDPSTTLRVTSYEVKKLA
ncbi:hypothetical protein ASE92_11765 [Pedobacter sp. Leaf41]|uniref:hypothetical protein n=1 Tax=Pedobacter sp. Leaf41 TaxID=1736218 RepID=UPI000702E342|nr:hypothetical protein [Pedobacter sp. Leaf41]KQN34281.1 hypothetical protein ASE92_11765 [Pedobacter sp. Leaf41]